LEQAFTGWREVLTEITYPRFDFGY